MILFETDQKEFGGLERLNPAHNTWFKVNKGKMQHNRPHSFQIYVPSRTAIVLAPFEFVAKHPELKMPNYDIKDPLFAPYLESIS